MRITAFRRLPGSLNTHNVICRSAFQRVCFTTGCTLQAARRPRPAPVRPTQVNSQPTTPFRKSEQEKVNEISFWPTELLQNANFGGGLSLGLTEAIHFLTLFRDLRPSPGSESMTKLLSEFHIEPLTLTLLAKILKSSGLRYCQTTASRLIIAASYLHDPGATLLLITEAVRTSNLTHPDIIGPRKHLEILVKRDKNPVAMRLLGEIREREGRTDDALSLYERAVDADSDTYTGVEAVESSIGEAWAKVCQLKLSMDDMEGAKATLEKAALQHDAPVAYYYLAIKFTAQDSANYKRYLMKAAASGMAEAAQRLGIYYHQEWKKDVYISPSNEGSTQGEIEVRSLYPKEDSLVSTEESGTNRLLASEWFSVAAEAGLPRSRISLAIILRSGNGVQKGMDWLNLEEFPADWADGVAKLKEIWWDTNVDLTWYPVDQLQKEKTP